MRLERHVLFWVAVLAIVTITVATLRDVLLPFVVGATAAYFLNPIADRLERAGMGRMTASCLVVGLAGLVVLAAFFLLLPLIAGQVRQLVLSLPGDLDRLRIGIDAWALQHLGERYQGFRAALERAYGELSQGSAGMLAQAAQVLWSRGLALFNLVSLLLVTPIVVFYFLRDWHLMLNKIDGWLPREHAATLRTIATDIDRAVGAFVRGQGTICLILGALYATALSAIGLRYGLIIGIMTGIFAFVPFVGWAAGLLVALFVALSQTWPEMGLAAWVFAIFAVGMALDSAVLSPGIVGQRIGLHPVWLMFALFVFSALFGFLGMLVAVPVAAALAVVVRFARDRYLESTIYLGAKADGAASAAPIPAPGQGG